MSNPHGHHITEHEILALINKRKQIQDLGINLAEYRENRSRVNDDNLSAINNNCPRELTSRPREVYTSRAREVLNNKTIKEYNNTSHEQVREDVTEAKSPLASSATPLERLSSQEDVTSVTCPRELTSRATKFSGIVAQHAITKSGIKVAITLQTEEWARTGEKLQVTGELKRYARLREIKSRLEDSSEFNRYLEETKQLIHELKDHELCLGRIHHRGKRASWIYDSLVIGYISNDILKKIVLHIEGENYEILFDKTLSNSQQQYYKAAGHYGEMQHITRIAPRIWDLPRKGYPD